MSRQDHDPRNDSRDPSPLFEALEPRAMLAGDFAIAWNGTFINNTPGSDAGLVLKPGTPTEPSDVNGGDKLLRAKKSSTIVRPVLKIGNVGDKRIFGKVHFEYFLRSVSAVDDSDDVSLFHKRPQGQLRVSTSPISNQVNIKNIPIRIPYNTPAGDYVLVAIISRKYDTPKGHYKKDATPLADADANEANNTAISAPFTVREPVFNLTAALGKTNVAASINAGKVSRGSVVVKVTNSQGLAATAPTGKVSSGAPASIKIYLRPVGASDDSQDVAVGLLKKASVGKLGIGKTRSFNLGVKIAKTLAAGSYKIVAVVDPLVAVDKKANAFTPLTGKLTELNDTTADNTTELSMLTITAD